MGLKIQTKDIKLGDLWGVKLVQNEDAIKEVITEA